MKYIVRAIIEYSRESIRERNELYKEMDAKMTSSEGSIVKIIKIEKIGGFPQEE